MTQKKSYTSAYVGWGFISLFFCYQYILRCTPGIITQELRSTFNMTAEEFANLGAIYLYAYAALQIPLGFLVDRIGIKKVVLASMLMCSFGTLLLGYTDLISVAYLSRFLIGAGSACAFMSAVKWVADHFPEGNRGFLMGATLTLGTAGALSAGTILVTLIENLTWRPAIMFTGWMGIGLFVLTLFFMERTSSTLKSTDSKSSFDWGIVKENLLKIAKNRNVLIYAALATGLYTPLSVLADLWGVSFLSQKFSIPRADAAASVMYLYIGLAMGCLSLPYLSERLGMFTNTIRLSIFIILTLFCIIVFGDITSLFVLKILFTILGFFAGAEMICFTGAVTQGIPGQAGLTVGFVNTLNMLGGAVLEQLIGKALDYQWSGAVNEEGLRLYTTEQYTYAMSILTVVVLLSVFISLALREKEKGRAAA